MKLVASIITAFVLCQVNSFSQTATNIVTITNIVNVTNIVNITNIRNVSNSVPANRIYLPPEEMSIYLKYSSVPPELLNSLNREVILERRQRTMMDRFYP